MMRCVLLPLALVAGLAVALASPAEAAPVSALSPHVGPALSGGVYVHVGGAAPVGPHGARPYRVPPRGHYVWRVERVWVPEELVAYDAFGHPVFRPGYWTERRVRVWVPIRRRGYVRRAAPYATVGFGFTYVHR